MSMKMITCLAALGFAVPMLATASPADARSVKQIGKAKVLTGDPSVIMAQRAMEQAKAATKPVKQIGKAKVLTGDPSVIMAQRAMEQAKAATKPVKQIGKAKVLTGDPSVIMAQLAMEQAKAAIKPAKQIGKAKVLTGDPSVIMAQLAMEQAKKGIELATAGKMNSGKGEGDGKGDHAGKWPKVHWVYGGHRPHIVEYVHVPSRRASVAALVAKPAPSTDPVCVQGTWAEQEEKKVHVCLSWYFRGRLLTSDQLAQVLAQEAAAQSQ